jgi:hypothetical protein
LLVVAVLYIRAQRVLRSRRAGRKGDFSSQAMEVFRSNREGEVHEGSAAVPSTYAPSAPPAEGVRSTLTPRGKRFAVSTSWNLESERNGSATVVGRTELYSYPSARLHASTMRVCKCVLCPYSALYAIGSCRVLGNTAL